VPVLELLQAAAIRTATVSAAISPAKGVRLRIHYPVPPRHGPSVLGLTLMPPRFFTARECQLRPGEANIA